MPPAEPASAAEVRGGVRVTRRLTEHERYLRLEVGPGPGAGWRLDKYLAAVCGRFSRSLLQRWIAAGCCRVDGRIADARHQVRSGELIELRVPLPVDRRDQGAEELRVLVADPGFLAVDKPPGQLAHQTGRVLTGTLLNHLWAYVEDRGQDPGAVRLVNRIDRHTGGIVLAGLRDPEHARLCADLRAGRFRKRYRAVAVGTPDPPTGHWRQPLGPGPEHTIARTVAADGRPCHTEYRVLEKAGDGRFSLLDIVLHTGRQHQIRLHAAANGCPLLGDWVYGEPCAELAGQCLHAAELRFPHPRGGGEVAVASPFPPIFATLWKGLRAGAVPTPRALTAAERSRLGRGGRGERGGGSPLPDWLSREERQAVEEEFEGGCRAETGPRR